MSRTTSLTEAEPFPYETAEYEHVCCNLCGADAPERIEETDRNGLPVKSVICTRCGLMYLTPRMTPFWYGKYYEQEYRRQMATFKKRPVAKQINDETRFARQRRRGQWLAQWLQSHDVKHPRHILDIGSSTGGVLQGLADVFDAQVTGVEPSPEEAAYANAQGIRTHVGLFEEVELSPAEPFDLILCTQSFNHLLDPRQVAERVRDTLSPEGVFFLECQDFFRVVELRRALSMAVQIDHVFMFVPETLQSLLEMSGFTVAPESVVCDRHQSADAIAAQQASGVPSRHVRLLARPSDATETPSSSYSKVHEELKALPDSLWKAKWARHWKQIRTHLRDASQLPRRCASSLKFRR